MKLILVVAVLMLLSVSRAFVQPALGSRAFTQTAFRMVRAACTVVRSLLHLLQRHALCVCSAS
jgi:hypothetical protein